MTAGRVGRRNALGTAAWCVSAVAIPIVALAAALVAEGQWRIWSQLPDWLRSQIAVHTLLLETVLIVMAAPLAGVAVVLRRCRSHDPLLEGLTQASTRPGAWRLIYPLGAGTLMLTATSAMVAWAVLGASANALPSIARAHATLATIALALTVIGAFCMSILADPLDAAACAVGLATVAAAGVLVAGPGIGDAPPVLINAALHASPIVAVAAAADVDILRMGVVYRLSPLAHVRVEYPRWGATCGFYGGLAITLFVAMTRTLGQRRILERTTT